MLNCSFKKCHKHVSFQKMAFCSGWSTGFNTFHTISLVVHVQSNCPVVLHLIEQAIIFFFFFQSCRTLCTGCSICYMESESEQWETCWWNLILHLSSQGFIFRSFSHRYECKNITLSSRWSPDKLAFVCNVSSLPVPSPALPVSPHTVAAKASHCSTPR